MINRRRFMQSIAAAAAVPSMSSCGRAATVGPMAGGLVADPNAVLDLPAGFSYTIVTRAGDEMDDGLLVPGRADGMAAFTGDDGRIILVCNHENPPVAPHLGPFGSTNERLECCDTAHVYDLGNGITPGTGGTTTIVYNPQSREKERQHLSLAGTEYNCAGGTTPWGSWLTCEEIFVDPGSGRMFNIPVHREQRHGYVFEVPARAEGLVKAVPLREMGRFEHEACAVDPHTGIVYLTEDKHRSLLYRFIPRQPGELAKGGRLQALAIADQPSFDTRNWAKRDRLQVGRWLETAWVDLDDADSDANDLRFRGFRDGAARFARGEGICYADGSLFITCTIGGESRLGQVFEYRLGDFDDTTGQDSKAGGLRLIAEATRDSILRNADNITMSPWGDLVVCEDTASHSGLVGITPDGSLYPLADNAYTSSELAGVCFSPDGEIMFVNIQNEGLTLAITGPWPQRSG